MIKGLSGFLGGERRYLLKCSAEEGAELFLRSGIPCFYGKVTARGYEVSTERRDGKRLEALLVHRGISFELLYEKGILPFLQKAAARPGLLLGLALALFFIYQSSQYVWQIRISGNELLSKEQVVDILEQHGFSVGCRYKSIDLHQFCNTVPMETEEIAWISVNMMGSVAEVQIIETVKKPQKEEPKDGLFNLVAEREGQIVSYELSSGRALVSVGSTVKKGQMLVAGFSEKDTGLFPKVSAGRVFAKVWLFEEVFVPFNQSKTVEKEAVAVKKSVNFLGKEIIFFKNSRFLEEKYVTIDDEYLPTVLGIALPLPMTSTYAIPFEEVSYTLSKEEAVKQAKSKLAEKIKGVSEELLFREYEVNEKKDGVYVTCKVLCITDIARQVEVTTDREGSP